MNKSFKNVIILFAIILFFILIFLYFKNYNSNFIIGGDDPNFLSAVILEIPDNSKALIVQLESSSLNSKYFEEETLILDCSHEWLSIQDLQVGDVIRFYFFKTQINGNNVKVQDIVKIVNK